MAAHQRSADHAGQCQYGAYGQVNAARHQNHHHTHCQEYVNRIIPQHGNNGIQGKHRRCNNSRQYHKPNQSEYKTDVAVSEYFFHALASFLCSPNEAAIIISWDTSLLSNSPVTCPDFITTIRSAIPSTSGISEETIIIA